MPDFDLDAALSPPPPEIVLPALSLHFGFAISTGDGYFLEENLTEQGYSKAEIATYFDGRLQEDYACLETNGMAILRANFTARDEGHGGHLGDLCGSAWIDLGSPQWNRLKGSGWCDGDESFCTGSGSIHALIPRELGGDVVYRGVSEMGQACLDLSISFFDLGAVKRWNDYEDGDGPRPPSPDDPDFPEHDF